MSPTPSLYLVTAHGRQRLEARPGERVLDLLQRHGVPWSAVATYIRTSEGAQARLVPCLDVRIDEIDRAGEILVYFNRNVNPFLFALDPLKVVPAAPEEEGAAEYIYQEIDGGSATAGAYLKKMSPGECRAVVRSQVEETVAGHLRGGDQLVVGVSGGGDSNALLDALVHLREQGVSVHPLIIKGIPEWDSGVERAQALCAEYGLDLCVYEEREVKKLVGLPESVGLSQAFERAFPGDDFEFLGTLLVRLALFQRARQLGTRFVSTGLNLEDVLCEHFFRQSNGLKPAGVPSRQIGEFTLLFPLWLCPKRIIDGCFPKHSLDNYDERYPCLSVGRNLYYSIVYSLQSSFPGFAERLARGLSDLADQDPVQYQFDEQLGFHIERFVPFPLRQRFERMRT